MIDHRKIAPAIHEFGHLNIPLPEETTLSNGIPLSIINHGPDEVCRLSLIWRQGGVEVGSMPLGAITGLVMREGAGGQSATEIAETLEFNGAQLRIEVSTHCSRLELIAPNNRIAEVLPAISDIITSPHFPTHESSVIIDNRARALEIERGKVGFHARHAINLMMMGAGHPLAVEDTPEVIRAITSEQIRSAWQRLFMSERPVAFLAGHITPAVVESIDSHIGAIRFPDGQLERLIIPFTPVTERRVDIHRPQSLQSAVRIAMPAIPRSHPDYIPLRILVMALGGYFGSRLMANVREDKGYTYGIHANLLGYREGAMTMIGCECDNKYTEALINECIREIERLATGDFSDDELGRVRSYVMSQLAALLDTPFSIGSYYENMVLADISTDYFDQQQSAATAISASSFKHLASTYLNPATARIAVAGATQNSLTTPPSPSL
ncbi:MAG: insulinase family protein [Pseudoflavonifractor sp.]|nr:insulinase family protein [Pseudoflavonifractor sp.]